VNTARMYLDNCFLILVLLCSSDVHRCIAVDRYYVTHADDLGEASGPSPHTFGVVDYLANYCSLVDKRCRDFIHWMRAASA
jgi:hypothetical protein